MNVWSIINGVGGGKSRNEQPAATTKMTTRKTMVRRREKVFERDENRDGDGDEIRDGDGKNDDVLIRNSRVCY